MPRTLQALLPALAVSLLVGAMPARAQDAALIPQRSAAVVAVDIWPAPATASPAIPRAMARPLPVDCR